MASFTIEEGQSCAWCSGDEDVSLHKKMVAPQMANLAGCRSSGEGSIFMAELRLLKKVR